MCQILVVSWLTRRSSASCRILDDKYQSLPCAYFIPGQARTPNKAEIVVEDLQRSSAKHRHRAASANTRRRGWVHAAGAVVAVAALLVTGSGYWMAHGMLSGITVSQALGSQDPKSRGGGMNTHGTGHRPPNNQQ